MVTDLLPTVNFNLNVKLLFFGVHLIVQAESVYTLDDIDEIELALAIVVSVAVPDNDVLDSVVPDILPVAFIVMLFDPSVLCVTVFDALPAFTQVFDAGIVMEVELDVFVPFIVIE